MNPYPTANITQAELLAYLNRMKVSSIDFEKFEYFKKKLVRRFKLGR